jgi:hypothetical protein
MRWTVVAAIQVNSSVRPNTIAALITAGSGVSSSAKRRRRVPKYASNYRCHLDGLLGDLAQFRARSLKI